MGRRGYPPEVRAEALAKIAAGRSAFRVAQDLGVSVQTVYRWVAEEAARDPAHGDGERTSDGEAAPD